jgi:hypothetical protein
MRRREPEPEPTVPAELVTFDPERWRDRGGVEGWIGARRQLLRAGVWPGDPIEALREHAATKRRAAMGR